MRKKSARSGAPTSVAPASVDPEADVDPPRAAHVRGGQVRPLDDVRGGSQVQEDVGDRDVDRSLADDPEVLGAQQPHQRHDEGEAADLRGDRGDEAPAHAARHLPAERVGRGAAVVGRGRAVDSEAAAGSARVTSSVAAAGPASAASDRERATDPPWSSIRSAPSLTALLEGPLKDPEPDLNGASRRAPPPPPAGHGAPAVAFWRRRYSLATTWRRPAAARRDRGRPRRRP